MQLQSYPLILSVLVAVSALPLSVDSSSKTQLGSKGSSKWSSTEETIDLKRRHHHGHDRGGHHGISGIIDSVFDGIGDVRDKRELGVEKHHRQGDDDDDDDSRRHGHHRGVSRIIDSVFEGIDDIRN
ncbi:hypothetical protein CYLTODRAFT_450905 [Cylindrobasidium torrendii FP15055 ss-10]|uniref:Uncharacterized protein n=1 Tax=Cylindrobasidium torrendii FP15055 ss-10 TaxID=1314674 RepID=A0A0D7BNV7_9AGAR|nr:hypothetical protein CYLTODRAFT_450905 [Cylindrobasidium torrendii FP15055 ss-10]